MSVDPQVRQQLLELVYDLLPAGEAEALRARLATDVALQQAYADAQAAAQTFSTAFRGTAPAIDLRRLVESEAAGRTESNAASAAAPRGPSALPARPRRAARFTGEDRSYWARNASWTVGLAAAVLLAVSLGGYFYHRHQFSELAAAHLRLLVAGPARVQTAVANTYTINTSLVTGVPAPAQIEFAVYALDGKALLRQQEATDQKGVLQLVIPPDAPLAPGARLEIIAQQNQNRQEVATPLAVEPARRIAHVKLDRSEYAPGETVYYRSLTIAWFAGKADRQFKVEHLVRDPQGKTVAGSTEKGVMQDGGLGGAFVVPFDAVEGEYQVAVRSTERAFPPAAARFQVVAPRGRTLRCDAELTRNRYAPGERVAALVSARRVGGAPAVGARLKLRAECDGRAVFETSAEVREPVERFEFTLPKSVERGAARLIVAAEDGDDRDRMARDIPLQLDRVEVSFYPEGGGLAAELPNRIYLTAHDPQGKPVALRAKLVNAKNDELALVETGARGLGAFTLIPSVKDRYRLKIDQPAGIRNEPELPLVDLKQKVVFQAGSGVFDAGKPIEFDVACLQPHCPLVVQATSCGVSVGHWTGVVEPGQPLHGKLPLASGVGGVVRLTAFDFSVQPPRLAAERLVYRRPERRLSLQFSELPACVAGEPFTLPLQTQNEKGAAVAADLGVAVVAAEEGRRVGRSPSMRAAFLLLAALDNPAQVADADALLAETPLAATALDQLLATQGGRPTLGQLAQRPGGEAPLLFDNLSQIRATYDRSLQAFHTQRERRFHALTTLSFFGGFALVLFVGMLTIVKIISGIRLWAPAVGAALCCLVVGAALMNPDRLQPGMHAAVAYMPNQTAVAEVAQRERLDRAAAPAELEADAFKAKAEAAPEKKAVPRPAAKALADAAMRLEAAAAPAAGPPPAPAMPSAARALKAPAASVARETPVGGDEPRQYAFSRSKAAAADKAQSVVQGRAMQMQPRAAAGPQQNAAQPFFAHLNSAVANAAMPRRRGALDEQFSQLVMTPADSRRNVSLASAAGVPPLLYWSPLLQADPAGRAAARFDIPAAVGEAYRVSVDAHCAGRIDYGETAITAAAPCQAVFSAPAVLRAGDQLRLPVVFRNGSNAALPVELTVETAGGLKLQGAAGRNWVLTTGSEKRELFSLVAEDAAPAAELSFQITAGGLTRALRHFIRVTSPGAPVERGVAGVIEGEHAATVDLPQQAVAGSTQITLRVFPTALAEIERAREAIEESQPLGFPAAAATAHLAALAVQCVEGGELADPATLRRLKEQLVESRLRWKRGESPLGGYDWLASSAGDETLSAYALAALVDMRRAGFDDGDEINRLSRWLLTRRDAAGRFTQNEKIPAALRPAAEWTDAYVSWALALAGNKGLDFDWSRLAETGGKVDDPYVVALAAAGLQAAGRADRVRTLLDKLAAAQRLDGAVPARDGAASATLQCTALAVGAWLKSPAHAPRAKSGMQWLAQSRMGAGDFGAPQATALALKAVVEYDRTQRRLARPGKLLIRREGNLVAEQEIAAGRQEAIVIAGLEKKLLSGANRLSMTLPLGARMRYALDVRYRTAAATKQSGPLQVQVQLDRPRAQLGQTVKLTAALVNGGDAAVPFPTLRLALPAGVEVRAERLRELKQSGAIGDFELRPEGVVCAWRAIEPRARIAITLELAASIPGRFVSDAARAGSLAGAALAAWAEPVTLEITAE